jgi:hypothetical protein
MTVVVVRVVLFDVGVVAVVSTSPSGKSSSFVEGVVLARRPRDQSVFFEAKILGEVPGQVGKTGTDPGCVLRHTGPHATPC